MTTRRSLLAAFLGLACLAIAPAGCGTPPPQIPEEALGSFLQLSPWAELTTGGRPAWLPDSEPGRTWTAEPGTKLAGIVDKMQPGDVLLLPPGDYGRQGFHKDFAPPGIRIQSQTILGAQIGTTDQVSISGQGYQFQGIDFVSLQEPKLNNLVKLESDAARIAFVDCWFGPAATKGGSADGFKSAGGGVADIWFEHCVFTTSPDDAADFNSTLRVGVVECIVTGTPEHSGHGYLLSKNSARANGASEAHNGDHVFARNVFLAYEGQGTQSWLNLGEGEGGVGAGVTEHYGPPRAVEGALVESNLFVRDTSHSGAIQTGWVEGVAIRGNAIVGRGGGKVFGGFVGVNGRDAESGVTMVGNLFIKIGAPQPLFWNGWDSKAPHPHGIATNQVWPKKMTVPRHWARPKYVNPKWVPAGRAQAVTREEVIAAGGVDPLRRRIAESWRPPTSANLMDSPAGTAPELNILGEPHSGKVGCW